MSNLDADMVFKHFRKVVCDLYFAGWKEGRDCAGCHNMGECYCMIQEVMEYAKTHKLRIAELQDLNRVH